MSDDPNQIEGDDILPDDDDDEDYGFNIDLLDLPSREYRSKVNDLLQALKEQLDEEARARNKPVICEEHGHRYEYDRQATKLACDSAKLIAEVHRAEHVEHLYYDDVQDLYIGAEISLDGAAGQFFGVSHEAALNWLRELFEGARDSVHPPLHFYTADSKTEKENIDVQ